MWPFIQNIINNTPKESLDNLTPAECVFGRSSYFPLDYELTKDQNIPKEPFSVAMNKYTSELWPALLEHQLSRYNKLVDQNDHQSKIKKGDFVLVWKPQLTDGKLSKMWAGPFKVMKHYSPTSFHLYDPETGATYRRSVRHLRKIGDIISESLRQKFPEPEIEPQITRAPEQHEPYDFSQFPFGNCT